MLKMRPLPGIRNIPDGGCFLFLNLNIFNKFHDKGQGAAHCQCIALYLTNFEIIGIFLKRIALSRHCAELFNIFIHISAYITPKYYLAVKEHTYIIDCNC